MRKKIYIGIGIFISIALGLYVYLLVTLVNNYENYKAIVVSRLSDPVKTNQSLTVSKDIKPVPEVKVEKKAPPPPVSSTNSKAAPAPEPQFGTSNSINILALGIDRTEERDKTLGIYRADTISIIRLNLDTKEMKVLCIPRDTYAFIPDKNKKDKINHSYAYGSLKNKAAEYTANSVNDFIKYSKIDYYIAMDMEPVPEIVDSIGGVELDVEIDMKNHGANLSKGLQLLDGKKAFDYIHWRYSGDGDIGRVKRQQKFAKATLKKLKDSGQLVKIVEIIFKYKDNLKTNLSLKQMLSLAALAKDISGESVAYHIIPGEGRLMKGIWYWMPYEERTDKLLKEFFSN